MNIRWNHLGLISLILCAFLFSCAKNEDKPVEPKTPKDAASSLEKIGLKADPKAFMEATLHGDAEKVDLFLLAGVDVNARDPERWNETVLMNAAKSGKVEILKKLLNAGAVVDAKDDLDQTAFMTAVEFGHLESAKLLLEKGAQINAKNKDGSTALILAAMTGKADVVKWLKENGADMKVKDNEGVTPLIYSARGNHTETTEMLSPGKKPRKK